MYLMPYDGNEAGAARISSNSWGSNAPGAYGRYTLGAMQIDQFMWDHPDFLFFISAGNERDSMTITPPATAKNCVTAGGTLNGGLAINPWHDSSRGPCLDGRLKPTVCAPAVLTSAIGTNPSAYGSLSGTSMSSPALAGTMLLARQYLMEGWYPKGEPLPEYAFTPSAALLKAMAVNCGQNDLLGGNVPNNKVGWGRVKLDDVLYFPGDARATLLVDNREGLATGESVECKFHLGDSSIPLKISLVWTDTCGAPWASPALVNDLDLIVEGEGQVYRGNNFSGGQSVPDTVADRLNVEECVWRTNPTPGEWRARVEAANVPFGPQPYALVVTAGASGFTSVPEPEGPSTLWLSQNAPNPFNPETALRFNLTRGSRARLTIYDVSGRLVRVLVDEDLAAGLHEAHWDGRDAHGALVASGIYFCRLDADRRSTVRKLVAVR
jgi:hypothetical protein